MIASELPAAEGLAFVQECADLLETAMAASELKPGGLLGPMLARYGATMGGAGARRAATS